MITTTFYLFIYFYLYRYYLRCKIILFLHFFKFALLKQLLLSLLLFLYVFCCCFSLDPDNDPLCVLLMIDFFALRSSQYTYLIQLCRVWDHEKCLHQLPNFAFSLALAMYHSACATGSAVEEADRLVSGPWREVTQ